ncbi:phage baseplate assembly protein V [Candidatus Acetatifactor stercoripullorum]|uniref:phage baseplate assembly protein V n=1 Tax=Candidatus Acetatifactor stercoripullorum TaxID=2838414 RepID=UPI00298D9558|nr:phage baseplate assembly protein V [Candidatus Acetatifactor stercoripullorum]
MRAQRITLEPFELLEVLQCSGTVCANQHGFMAVKGYMESSKEDEYLQLLTEPVWSSVKVYDENEKSEILFTGIVTYGAIGVENGLKTLEVILQTGSFLMDLDFHIRAFQDSGCTYDQILASFGSSYQEYDYIMETGNRKSINRFLCQYEETDWEFAKFIADLCGTAVYPNYIGSGIKFYFGRPAGAYRGQILLTEFGVRQTNMGVFYEGTLREIYDLGDSVSFHGNTLSIIKRQTEMQKGELYHTYTFSSQVLEQQLFHASRLAGISLEATVMGVKGTSVTLQIHKNEYPGPGRWFPYATVYSSPDGSGWYCMPETGDSVRLYFPSEDENEAYVLSSVHLPSSNSAQRTNPDYKSIMNKQGKEILLKPDSILVTNNNGMSVELADQDGISIISDKKITIQSEEAIEITSVKANIDLVSPKKISLKQGNTSMVLSESMMMTGTKVRLN